MKNALATSREVRDALWEHAYIITRRTRAARAGLSANEIVHAQAVCRSRQLQCAGARSADRSDAGETCARVAGRRRISLRAEVGWFSRACVPPAPRGLHP